MNRDDPQRSGARRVMRAGFLALAVGAMLLLLPLLIGAALGRFLAVAGFISGCLGACLLLTGAIDAWRGR